MHAKTTMAKTCERSESVFTPDGEVLNYNFDINLASLKETLPLCEFISLDCEFSGLNLDSSHVTQTPSDTPQTRYSRARMNVSNFTLMQLGVCLFIRNTDPVVGGLVAMPFNFYCLQKPWARDMLDRRFTIQTSSALFLAENHFDFNKWLYHGITYLSHFDEARILASEMQTRVQRARLSETPEKPAMVATQLIDIEFEIRVRSLVQEWRQRRLHFLSIHSDSSTPVKPSYSQPPVIPSLVREESISVSVANMLCLDTSIAINGDVDAVELDDDCDTKTDDELMTVQNELDVPKWLDVCMANSFQRALTYQIIEREFPDLMAIKVILPPETVSRRSTIQLRIKIVSQEEQKRKRVEKVSSDVAAFDDRLMAARGVRLVFDLLCASKRPLVLHNPLLDLMHIYQAFIGPLPTMFSEFNTNLRQHLVGDLYDTKRMTQVHCEKNLLLEPQRLREAYDQFFIPFAEKSHLHLVCGPGFTLRYTLPSMVIGTIDHIAGIGPNKISTQGTNAQKSVLKSNNKKDTPNKPPCKQLHHSDNKSKTSKSNKSTAATDEPSSCSVDSKTVSIGASEHDAAYDALLTGALFIALTIPCSAIVGDVSSERLSQWSDLLNVQGTINSGSDLLYQTRNLVHMYQSPIYMSMPAPHLMSTTCSSLADNNNCSCVASTIDSDAFATVLHLQLRRRCSIWQLRAWFTKAFAWEPKGETWDDTLPSKRKYSDTTIVDEEFVWPSVIFQAITDASYYVVFQPARTPVSADCSTSQTKLAKTASDISVNTLTRSDTLMPIDGCTTSTTKSAKRTSAKRGAKIHSTPKVIHVATQTSSTPRLRARASNVSLQQFAHCVRQLRSYTVASDMGLLEESSPVFRLCTHAEYQTALLDFQLRLADVATSAAPDPRSLRLAALLLCPELREVFDSTTTAGSTALDCVGSWSSVADLTVSNDWHPSHEFGGDVCDNADVFSPALSRLFA